MARDGRLAMRTQARNQRRALLQWPVVVEGVRQHLDELIADLDRRIAVLEAEIAALEGELADPAVATDRDLVAHAAREHRSKQEELSWLMREWEEASVAVEEAG